MKGVATVVSVIFIVGIVMLVGVTALEPVGEEVKKHDSIDTIGGTGIIDSTYDVVFKWMPLFVMGGFLIWAIAWYLRQERLANGGFR